MRLRKAKSGLIVVDGMGIRLMPAGNGFRAWIQVAKDDVVLNLNESGLRPMGQLAADDRPEWRPER